ncbi:hypothetical protein JCM11641_006405 [Rhodosporidiobolus odoratus]
MPRRLPLELQLYIIKIALAVSPVWDAPRQSQDGRDRTELCDTLSLVHRSWIAAAQHEFRAYLVHHVPRNKDSFETLLSRLERLVVEHKEQAITVDAGTALALHKLELKKGAFESHLFTPPPRLTHFRCMWNDIHAPLPSMPTVRVLSLSSVYFLDRHLTKTFLASFPNLATLAVYRDGYSMMRSPYPMFELAPKSLRTVCVYTEAEDADVYTSLTSFPHPPKSITIRTRPETRAAFSDSFEQLVSWCDTKGVELQSEERSREEWHRYAFDEWYHRQ